VAQALRTFPGSLRQGVESPDGKSKNRPMLRRWKHGLDRLRLGTKLGILAAAATTAVLAGTAYLTIRLFRGQLLELAAEASSSQSDALRLVLEQQMTQGDLGPLRRLVTAMGREPHVRWVAVVNAEGHVRISSDGAPQGAPLEKDSPDCRACHQRAPADRLRSVTLAGPGEDVLRTVTPIANREACHRCHGGEARLNGVLIVDRSLAPVQRALLSSRAQVMAGSAAAVLALLATLGLAVERLVLARLRRLGKAARQLGAGDRGARAPEGSADELGALARDFNAMAGALSAALAGLAAERRQLEELVDGIADGVVLADVALKVVTVNSAFAERLPEGWSAARGSRHADLARAAGFAADDGCSSLAQRALTTDRLEKAIVRVAGSRGERVEEIHARPLRGPAGEVVAVVEVWRDITDRLALEAGLEQSERLAAIGILASSVAHEVGNPLAAIAAAVEGLLRRMDRPEGTDPVELREYLGIVHRQVFRCREVTERLLGFARVPSRQVGPVDAAASAREVLALVTLQARAAGGGAGPPRRAGHGPGRGPAPAAGPAQPGAQRPAGHARRRRPHRRGAGGARGGDRHRRRHRPRRLRRCAPNAVPALPHGASRWDGHRPGVVPQPGAGAAVRGDRHHSE
jgi:signal transduction histidine kinase